MASFVHPIHARGVRSANLAVRGGKLLTNRKILSYMKAGAYGPDRQAEALGQKPKAKRRPPQTAQQLLWELKRKLGL